MVLGWVGWVGVWVGEVAVGQSASSIRLNTLGYLPEAVKVAVMGVPAERFAVVRLADGSTALSGLLSAPVKNPDTGETLYPADFTALREAGEYKLVLDEKLESAAFQVSTQVYRGAFAAVVRAIHLGRCGTAVRWEEGGRVFGHEACHTNDAWMDFVTGRHERRPAVGGWHDGSDYNKSVVNAGVTMGALFRAWEDFGPAVRQVPLGLPGVPEGWPEFLAELKWETDWLLSMQGPDGSVYHKVSTTNVGAVVMPEREGAARYFTRWSSAATADLVAAMSMAARHFRPLDALYADRCQDAARRGRAFLQAHPANTRADQSGFRTAPYATHDADDRLWAAAEYWETTGSLEALREVERRIATAEARVEPDFDWGSVANLGIITYVGSGREGRDPILLSRLRGRLLETADEIVDTARAHGYARPLGVRYYPGCHGSVARQVMLLQAAYRLSPKSTYRQTALDAIHHLFGKNVHGRSFVTGLGASAPRYPQDRRSQADEVDEPWPGYLVGGPHPRATDWKDDPSDVRGNDINLNWNAALAYALAGFLEGSPAGGEGGLPRKPDVGFVATPMRVVEKMLEMAELRPGDVLYDLGCGDGRIVVTAARKYGIRAVGFDIDPERIRESLANARTNQVEHLTTFRQEDIFTLDLSEASVITLYLLPELNERLRPTLARLPPGTRILSHDFPMRGAKPLRTEHLLLSPSEDPYPEGSVTEHTIYEWVVPLEPERKR